MCVIPKGVGCLPSLLPPGISPVSAAILDSRESCDARGTASKENQQRRRSHPHAVSGTRRVKVGVG